MKTTLLIIALTTLTAGASHAADIVTCSATCIAFDYENKLVVPVADVTGSSEIGNEEALSLMQLECKRMAQSVYGVNARMMTVQAFEASSEVSGSQEQHSEQSSSQSRGTLGQIFTRLPARTTSNSSANGNSSSFQKGMSYKVQRAGYESCHPIQSNPNGRPKYQGDLNLLG